MGGLTALTFLKAASEALLWAIGDDDEDMLTKARESVPSTWMKDLIVYGLPGATAGVDLTGSLSIEVPRGWKDLIGVPYAAIEDSVNMTKSYQSGATFRALAETPFTPIVARNAMRGIELFTTGHGTRSGRDISAPGERGPRKITGPEAVKKALLGLQPTSVSKGYGAYQATRRLKESLVY